jgi:serine/threonine protein kinase/protein involved in polysaccharide export with SLBB domain
MQNHRTTCDPQLIERFLDHRLGDEEQTALESHLSDCDECCRRLEASSARQDIWSGVREFLRDEQLPPDPGAPGRPGDSDSTGEEAFSSRTTVLKLLAPTDDDRMIGRWGSYEVVGVVGMGGMGVVLKAFDAALNRYVAIKVLAPHLGSSGAARRRFSREAKASAAVVHDNVIEIYGVSEAAGLPYLVMPYVRGPSLQRRLDDEGTLELAEILRVGMQAAAGLAAAHAQGLVHRDVKPANILLADGIERVKLTDFGLARAADDASLTKTGVIAGTPQYMSPEQARGEPVDQRSDLFSLGSVLYAMCAGRPPFRAETSYGVLRRITDEEPRPIREINPGIPEWLCGIVARLMAKRPDDRFQSAAEVAGLLEQCLAHVQQPTAAPLPPFSPLPPAVLSRMGEGQGVRAAARAFKPRKSLLKGVLAMLTLVGISLFAIGVVSTTPPDLSGTWHGDDWGQVTLKQTAPGEYTGTYTDTVAKEKGPGKIDLKWSRIERRFNGAWREGEDDRFGDLSIRLAGDEIRGALTTDEKSKINSATPRLADLVWARAEPTADSAGTKPIQPVLATPLGGIPSEKSKVSLPAYRIEPPDVISIEMLKLIPLPPYHAETFDVLHIHANALPDQPIDSNYLVEAEGTINLGPTYGTVRVKGMTIPEIKTTLNKWLMKWLRDPQVSVQVTRVTGAQPVSGQYLVGPDGTINLRRYGIVHLAGKTVPEARAALQKHLAQHFDSPEVSVEVVAYNSKVYYVITQLAGQGDSVRRLPITGNDTVLDAIANVGGLSDLSKKKLWIVRPAPNNSGKQKIPPIDWDRIVQGAQTETNYQLFPGDRLFIADAEKATGAVWRSGTAGAPPHALDFGAASRDAYQTEHSPPGPTSAHAHALQFDGASSYVDLGPALDFKKDSTFTVSFWINSAGVDQEMMHRVHSPQWRGKMNENVDQQIVGKIASFFDHDAPGWTVFVNKLGFLYFRVDASSEAGVSQLQVYELRSSLCDGKWHHVVVSYGGNLDASSVAFYIDGAAQPLGIDSNNLRAGDSRNKVHATIGATATGKGFFRGALSEMGIFDYALTAVEAAQLYSAGSGTFGAAKLAGLVAGYDFDEGQGSTVDDVSGRGRNGTLHGGATWVSGRGTAAHAHALHFDQLHYAMVPRGTKFTSYRQFTISLWLRPESKGRRGPTVSQYIVNRNYFGRNQQGDFVLRINRLSGELDFCLWGDNGKGPGWIFGWDLPETRMRSPVRFDQWNHVVITRKGDAYTMWMNGKRAVTEHSSANVSDAGNTNPFTIGGATSEPGVHELFLGDIDDFRVFRRCLTEEEIGDLNKSNGDGTLLRGEERVRIGQLAEAYWKGDLLEGEEKPAPLPTSPSEASPHGHALHLD